MKNRMILSLALTLSVLVSLVTLPQTTQGQQPGRLFAYDTGIITPGPGQVLRITVNGSGGNDAIRIRFRRMQYLAGNCNADGVCVQVIQGIDASSPLLLPATDGASMDVLGNGNGVRVVVESNSRGARVNAQLIDSATGQVNSIIGVLIAL